MKESTLAINPLYCSLCDYKFSRSSHLMRHERIHTVDKPFSCSQCDYKCSTSSALKSHERIHTCEKLFSCSQCEYKCSGPSDFKRDEKTHTGDRPFTCSQCNKSFASVQYSRKHESKCFIKRQFPSSSFLQEIKTEPR